MRRPASAPRGPIGKGTSPTATSSVGSAGKGLHIERLDTFQFRPDPERFHKCVQPAGAAQSLRFFHAIRRLGDKHGALCS